ncbi:Bcr/CflA family efflux MFS transporter [Rhodobacteraceae bacterium 2CG4]|uniref:Bcr/CflA family efflux transporter n=1 Tax=Halovulum marinum TaxID=2662447 RepID=A0A6L5YVS1_9RHOB|nr:multidrug effflux MFS transporter [Halovulum marinum]MSU88150.1 Bcr/CflA family efflux MFS transporter [Halovulum marinum]
MTKIADPSAAPPSIWLDRATAPRVLTLVLIAGLGALNMNIFLPTLPAMAAFFQTDYALVQLAVSAYLGVTALLQLVVGPLSDRYGRRPVMLAGLAIFLVATVACILSTNIVTFLVFRMIQATVATGIVLSRAVVRDMVSADKAASMIGYVTMGMSLVPMVGPVLGGILGETFGWQSTFIFTLLFGLGVSAIVYLDMGETNRTRSASFGEQFRSYPELVRSRRFWGYALIAAFASGGFFAFLGGAPYVASRVLGMTPGETGLYFGLIAVGYMIGNGLSGRYAESIGINGMAMMGSVTAVAGMVIACALFLVGIQTPLSLFGPILLVGLGNGLTLPSANAGMVSVRPHLAGSASGLGGALMIGGGAALSAITGALLGPGSGAWPLLLMMLATLSMGIAASVYVVLRARVVEAQGGDPL